MCDCGNDDVSEAFGNRSEASDARETVRRTVGRRKKRKLALVRMRNERKRDDVGFEFIASN